jgi:hypothetical protein
MRDEEGRGKWQGGRKDMKFGGQRRIEYFCREFNSNI